MNHTATIALPFCGFRDYIALAHTTSCVRALPEVARTLRVFREAIDGESLEYLRDICEVCLARVKDTYPQLVIERMFAHARMRDVPLVADWAESVIPCIPIDLAHTYFIRYTIDDLKSDIEFACGNITNAMRTTRGHDNMYDICRFIAAGFGREEHFEWIDNMCCERDSHDTANIARVLYEFMATPNTNKRACGEWIECWLAHDIPHARELFPFSRATTCAIFAQPLPRVLPRYMHFISASIGPLLARRLLEDHGHMQIIMQFAHDSPEMEQCFAHMRTCCAQLQVYMDETNKTRQLRYCSRVAAKSRRFINDALSASAMNPNTLVFARICDIARASECLPAVCDFEWTYSDTFSTMKCAIDRLESAHMRVSFRAVHMSAGVSQIIQHMSRDDAIACADFMLSRMASSTRYKRGSHMHNFLRTTIMFGVPLARIVRAYFGNMQSLK